MSQRLGRPKTKNPKEIRYSIRLDATTEEVLRNYCNDEGISKGEAFRRGVMLLLGK